MAKSKEATLAKRPQKHSTEQLAKEKSQKASLSQELVGDSDDEDQVAKTKPAPVKKNGIKVSSQTNGSVAKLPSKSQVTESSASDESSGDDSEDTSDDSEDSEDAEPPSGQPTPKRSNLVPAKVNGVKRKVDEHISTNESSSDQESKPQAKRTKKTEASSEEQSADSDEAGSTHSAIPLTSTPPSAQPPPSAPVSASAGQFKPPNGYTPLPKSSIPTTTTTFKSSNLAGKQIWHITAPSGLPLSSLTSLAADSLQTSATVLTHKGVSYTLRPDDNPLSQPLHLFLPSAQFPHPYERAEIPVTRTLHLQPKLTLPSLPRGATATDANVAAAPVSSVRPQPRGLRMRYRPPGFGAGDPGRIGSGSEGEEEDKEDGNGDGGRARTGVQFPAVLGASGGPKERDADKAKQRKGKKEKKKEERRKKEKSEREGKSGEKEKEDEEKQRNSEQLSKEERKAEKEAKRARKEAKEMAAKVVDAATK